LRKRIVKEAKKLGQKTCLKTLRVEAVLVKTEEKPNVAEAYLKLRRKQHQKQKQLPSRLLKKHQLKQQCNN
jgi:hypothetical protein